MGKLSLTCFALGIYLWPLTVLLRPAVSRLSQENPKSFGSTISNDILRIYN